MSLAQGVTKEHRLTNGMRVVETAPPDAAAYVVAVLAADKEAQLSEYLDANTLIERIADRVVEKLRAALDPKETPQP